MRLVVVKTKDGVSAIPMSYPFPHYTKRYEVITVVNKPWNYYHVSRIKSYYAKRGNENVRKNIEGVQS